MTETNYRGIDYGLGQTNIDTKGIRYGVIPCDSLASWIWDELEPEYDNPHCPECGIELIDSAGTALDIDCLESCPHCDSEIKYPERCYPESPDCHSYNRNGLQMHTDRDCTDLWIIKSPYVTRAQFCSPCAPGAVYLLNPCHDGEYGYCLPADWFDSDNPCPYVVSPIGVVYVE